MSAETDTPGSTRFEKLVLEKIHGEMRVFSDTQELMRRDLSALKESFAEWRGESKGREKLDKEREKTDGKLEERVVALEAFREQAKIFQAKTVAYAGIAALSSGLRQAGFLISPQQR